MGRRLLVLALLAVAAPAAISGQTLVTLHIRAVVTDATGQPGPLARHALLISDEPPTREPRRIVTSVDGTADVRLRPGAYVIESDNPVALLGKSYRWRQTVTIPAGRDSDLDLTVGNAVIEEIDPGTASGSEPVFNAPPASDTSLALRQWLDSVVELWTPAAHGSGFLIDPAGIIATNERIVGDATSVEVQLSRSLKVAGTVLGADAERGVAIVRIDPSLVTAMKPLPLACPGAAPSVSAEDEIVALATPLRQRKGWTPGTATSIDARGIDADLSLAAGGTGGPVFTESGALMGITVPDGDEPSTGTTRIVRIDGVCELVAAAQNASAPPPPATPLPVEPTEPAPVTVFKEAVTRRAGSLSPYRLTASDFDVTFITPLLNYAAQARSNQDFGRWSDYVADIPPVVFVRVTPKMSESFWAKMARGAAYTQGVALPPLTRLKTGFERMQAFCDGTEVTPIHPFTIELRVSETEAVHEGLYAFDPAAFGSKCSTVTLTLYSEKEPAKADTRVVDRVILQQIRRDLEVGRTP